MDNKQPDKKAAAAIKRRAIVDFTWHYYLNGPDKGDEPKARQHAKLTVTFLQLFDKLSPSDQDYALWILKQLSAEPEDGEIATALAHFNSAKTKAAKGLATDELRTLYQAGQAAS